MTKNYVFSYGSLILKKSRDRTGVSGEVFPARVKGYQRIWGDRHGKGTYLAIKEDSESSCNGVIVEIPKNQLEKFDAREEGLTRSRIDKEEIKRLDREDLPDGNYWVYIPDETKEASENFPIPQSYIDVILTGCLEIGKDFAKEFIKTTKEWNYIENDRENPKYPRALDKLRYKEEINNLLDLIKLNKLKKTKNDSRNS